MYRIVGCILIVAAGAGNGIFRKYETFGADSYTGKTASDGDLPERRDPRWEASLPDAFYGAAGRMNGKYREFLISAADRMKAGTGEKLSQICRECAESSPGKKSCLIPWGKGRFFFFRRISGLYGSGNADATAFPV